MKETSGEVSVSPQAQPPPLPPDPGGDLDRGLDPPAPAGHPPPWRRFIFVPPYVGPNVSANLTTGLPSPALPWGSFVLAVVRPGARVRLMTGFPPPNRVFVPAHVRPDVSAHLTTGWSAHPPPAAAWPVSLSPVTAPAGRHGRNLGFQRARLRPDIVARLVTGYPPPPPVADGGEAGRE
jgi:hypothetical protein